MPDRDLDHLGLMSMMRMMHQLRVAMCVMHLLGGFCDLLLNFGLLLGTLRSLPCKQVLLSLVLNLLLR